MLKKITGTVLALSMLCAAAPPMSTAAAIDSTDLEICDVNGDGRIDAKDASTIISYYSYRSTGKDGSFAEFVGSEEGDPIGDVNMDGRVNAIDASYILNFYVYLCTGGTEDSYEMVNPDAVPQTYTDDNGFSADEIAGSELKPRMYITVDGKDTGKVIVPDDFTNNEITCTLRLDCPDGAERGFYSTFGIHVYYDPRLTLKKNSIGKALISKGYGSEYLDGFTSSIADDLPDDVPCFFISSMSSGNNGENGDIAEFTFKLPENARPGDVYPIDICYKTGDLFTNNKVDRKGSLMQAYLFTQGINDKENLGLSVDPGDAELCPALNDLEKHYDGYIAIAGGQTSETTTVPDEDKLWGDANVDGKVDLNDAVAILQYVALPQKYPLTAEGMVLGDVDGTDGISGTDALSIQKYDAHVIDTLPEN